MTDIKLCPAISNGGTHCEEIKGHTPLELWGRKFDHAAHTQGIAWNEVPGDAAARSWEAELLAALPPHTFVETREGSSALASALGLRDDGPMWMACFTTPSGGWTIYRPTVPAEPRVTVRGQGVKVQLANPSVQTVIDTLRVHGALDDPAITGVSWDARRWLANEFEAYALACAKRLGRNITTHEEAHLDGMSAGSAWLRGEISEPPEPKPVPETEAPQWRTMVELIRDAWPLIRTAHGGQPWTAAGAWQAAATEWRDAFRCNNPSAELVEEAWSLIRSVEGGNWNDAPLAWQKSAADWHGRYATWLGDES